MKKLILAGLLAMVGLGGCAGVKLIAEAPYQIVHQNVLDAQCSMKSQVLVGPCKDLTNFSDCAPNYPKVKECRENGHWSCLFEAVRIATAMDPTLGVCQGPIKQ
ncbi:MAG: hypothetical protein J0I24_14575 [Thiomonas arsenitoxydans]|uniref:Lipoprotein n=1 Tax=Thiomonas arsenitoxydans (strain DSM 22701 / CIP 110005 / 3As) TaxID=426114 RepID=A0A8I1SWK9_THIA3|nr:MULTISPECIES: hypothetical protein [Thiomonas]MBN8745507.1 hypothetical protein [Thiomonas arsenitoxydans]ODU96305.1 MAG: hypothetical protein ABT24_09575 [Thiomonas sp. SCN 64-16]